MTMLCLILMLFAEIGLAGNRVGNGGDVVACDDKIQLLDFYESQGMGFPKSANISRSYREIAGEKIAALSRLAPKLGSQYQRRLERIEDEFDFRNDVELIDIKDSKHAFLPDGKGCGLRQIVIRKSDIVEGHEKRFVVSQTLWRRLNDSQKAGLILHEIIYEHFSKLGETDSAKARKLNALLFSEDLRQMTSGKFWLFIKSLEIPLYP